MKKLIRSAATAFFISDTGQTVPGEGELIIDPANYDLYARSESVIAALISGDLVYNDGNADLSVSNAIDHLRGFQEKLPKTALNIPIISTQKPDGNSYTAVSHNFCDSATWPSGTDSRWVLEPGPSEIFKLLKAEVQFSHDIQLASATPPVVFRMKTYAGGSVVDEKVFDSISDVFDLGNAHYSMPVSVDGIPGMSTVQFDYADAIVLYGAYGMKVEFSTDDNSELGGTYCSVSLVVSPQ